MTKLEFCDAYVIAFLAAYGAEKYDFHCQTGTMPTYPITDARFMADEAWDKYQEPAE